jgi:hypothetical protein
LHDRIPEKVESPILAQRKVAGYAKKVCGKQTNGLFSASSASSVISASRLFAMTGQMIST